MTDEQSTDFVRLTSEVVAKMWRDHAACTWVSTGVNVMWSCGIWHPGPIHMQPTTRDRHFAALVMTQVEADRVLAERNKPSETPGPGNPGAVWTDSSIDEEADRG